MMDRMGRPRLLPSRFVAMLLLLLLVLYYSSLSLVAAAPQGGTIAGTTTENRPIDGRAIGQAAFGPILAVLVENTDAGASTTKTRIEQGSYIVLEKQYIRRVSKGVVTTLVNRSNTSSSFTTIGELNGNYLVLDSSVSRCVRSFSKTHPHHENTDFYGNCNGEAVPAGSQGLDVDASLNTVYVAQTYESIIIATKGGNTVARTISRKTSWQPLRISVLNSTFGVAVDAKFDIYTVDIPAASSGSTVPKRVTNNPERLFSSKPLTPITALDRKKEIFYYLTNPSSKTANSSSIVKWDLKTNTFSTLYTFSTVASKDGGDPTFSSVTSMTVTPDSNIIIGQEGRLRYLLVKGITHTPTMIINETTTTTESTAPLPTAPPRTRTKTIRAFANITASFLVAGFPLDNETEMEQIKALMRQDAEDAMDGLTPIGDLYIETVEGQRYFTVVFTDVYLDKQEEAQRRLDNCQWSRLRQDFSENHRGAICVYQDGESECDAHPSTRCDSLGCHLAVALTIALFLLILLLLIIFLALTVGGRAFLKSALLLYPVAP